MDGWRRSLRPWRPLFAAGALVHVLLALICLARPGVAAAADPGFAGLGRPCADRSFWSAPLIRSALTGVIQKADTLVAAGVTPWDEQAYREYERSGSRVGADRMMIARVAAISPLVLAACVTVDPRYSAALEALFRSFVTQPVWVLSADDPGLKVLAGARMVVDLHATELGGELGEALYLLGAMIDPNVARSVRQELRRRVVDPVLDGERSGDPPFWLRATHNWNANCLSGFLAAALASQLGPEDRTAALEIAGTFIRFYLQGFDQDGYTPEGMSYWNYGFSRFALLRETLLEAQGVDLLADAHARAAAALPLRFEMFPGVVAAFGDALLGQPPDRWTLAYVARAEAIGPDKPGLPLRTDLLRFGVTSLEALSPPAPAAAAPALALSDYFAHARILVSRPALGSGGVMGVTIKGSSGGPHSHDDIGSYAVFLCDTPVLGDPGGGTFYSREQNRKRDNPIANSYGHPVPLVDGAHQDLTSSPMAAVEVTRTPDADTMRLDLTPVYPHGAGTSIVRTLVSARSPAAFFTMTDEVELPGGGRFDSPLTTTQAYAIAGDRVAFGQGGDEGTVTIEASFPVDIRPETIEKNGLTFTRIAIASQGPVARGRVRYTYRPPPAAACRTDRTGRAR